MLDHYFLQLAKTYPIIDQARLSLLQRVSKYYFEQVHHFNFTGHKTEATFYYLNILDSILPALEGKMELMDGMHVADLGTGGGFPGVPLAILFPQCQFVLFDSVQKKLQLIDLVCKEFSITNVKTVHTRLEEAGQQMIFRERFDVVTAKALAHWNTLSEYCLPLVKVGGTMSVYISKQQSEDVTLSSDVLNMLGGTLKTLDEYVLPDAYGERYVAHITKIKKTPPIYPRKVGTPKDHPLS